jgi:hypothetical protein
MEQNINELQRLLHNEPTKGTSTKEGKCLNSAIIHLKHAEKCLKMNTSSNRLNRESKGKFEFSNQN